MAIRRVWLILLVLLVTGLAMGPAGATPFQTKTFDSHLVAQINPCDGSLVPERFGTTTLRVAAFDRQGGNDRVLVGVRFEISSAEYTTVLVNEATFDGVADEYTFGARSLTYRNDVLEFISLTSQTVFMAGDRPVAHLLFGGPGSFCVR